MKIRDCIKEIRSIVVTIYDLHRGKTVPSLIVHDFGSKFGSGIRKINK